MWKIFLISFILLLNYHINQACHIEFDKLDRSHILRHVYEQGIFNITGQLQYCPPSIIIRNVSIANPSLKSLNVLSASFFIETNQIQITVLAKLIGFAPLNIELYFEDNNEYVNTQINRLIQRSTKNATIEQRVCSSLSSTNRMEILQKCPMLRLERGYYVLSEEIIVAVKRRQTIIDVLFTGVVMILLTFGRLCIGCDLEIQQMIDNFKRPIPLLIGLACQIVYLPLLSIFISKVFQLDRSTNLGLLSTASAPGKNYY